MRRQRLGNPASNKPAVPAFFVRAHADPLMRPIAVVLVAILLQILTHDVPPETYKNAIDPPAANVAVELYTNVAGA